MTTTTHPTRQLAEEITTVLDEIDRPGWTVKDGHFASSTFLVSPDGMEFFVRDYRDGSESYCRASDAGKVEIHPSSPAGLRDHWPYRGYNVARPEMKASASRGARAIAKDLVRKLLGQAREEMAQAQANKAESEAADVWEQDTMTQVADALGVPAPLAPPVDDWRRKDWRPKVFATPEADRNGSVPGYRRVEVEASRYSRSVTLNVHDVTPEVALRIAAVLAESEAWSGR